MSGLKSMFGLIPSLFGGGGESSPAPASVINVPEPSKPRVTRMPNETDPTIVEAAQRTRRASLMRRGRLSTIMTDQGRDTVGSSGQSLGA